jgi:hypothetical protein
MSTPRYRLCTALGVTVEQTEDLDTMRAWAIAYGDAANARFEILDGSHALESWEAGLRVASIERHPFYVWLTKADIPNFHELAA